ncbi:MAG: type II toxin-antitoxin system RelE/ParE family toxin [Chloroflexota bacterium]|nr:MAG: type II toxin-antitoxin system RelE/ParE family toxin [Chloroflexota bacterium]
MAFTVELTPPAERELRALPQDAQARIIPHLRALANNSRPSGCKKLVGERDLYRIRIGDYRAIY